MGSSPAHAIPARPNRLLEIPLTVRGLETACGPHSRIAPGGSGTNVGSVVWGVLTDGRQVQWRLRVSVAGRTFPHLFTGVVPSPGLTGVEAIVADMRVGPEPSRLEEER